MDIRKNPEARTLDEWEEVRTAWLGTSRGNNASTGVQVETGLTDENWGVRLGWAELTDWTPTPEQVERGLADMHWQVRISWAKRMDFTPTPEQMERGLADVHQSIRTVYVEREDFTPTQKQIDRGLADVCEEVRLAWITKLRQLNHTIIDDKIIEDCGIQSI